MGGAGSLAPLDFGAELWKWDEALYESAGGIVDAFTCAGRMLGPDTVMAEITMSLVRDVVDAAGGLERACAAFDAAVSALDDAYKLTRPVLEEEWVKSEPLYGKSFADPAAEDAWYALEDALVWARTLDERLRRRAADRKRFPDQGLIPALADGPRRNEIIKARSELLAEGLREARYLTGLSLHMQSMVGGTKWARVVGDALVLPYPDPVNAPISHRWQLTYTKDRDARSVVPSLMLAVESFMDNLIGALERNIPARFRTPNS